MSKITAALETAVATVIENSPKDRAQTNRERVYVDRAFAQILKLIAPRIRHFIRQYGLTGHWEDAEQCCGIAVHRAIQAYEPAKAQFTTFVNWQIRGELQSLRFRLMTDQRPSAKKVEATTVSLSGLSVNIDGEDISPELLIADEDAVERTEAAASDYLAEGAIEQLIDAYVDHLRKVGIEQIKRRPRPKREEAKLRREAARLNIATHGIDPAELEKLEAKLSRDREIVARRVFQTATLDDLSLETSVTKERVRQITKRAAKTIAEITAADPRFAVMAETLREAAPRKPMIAELPAATATTALLPDPSLPHNRLSTVTRVAPERKPIEAPAQVKMPEFGLEALMLPVAAPARDSRIH
ncbi:sigma factor-like helix-turn-helix DNA-binding protein [Sphingomonas sp.]|uniref:sigma factor-like helix-turn-helix DNA-binding protein n=1 Tax=Sphingomonas sp. TaxID=28214 RepID=UPI001B2D3E4D|nr:sigma factor-like helix-turn-helix DNA-binding protein [Sphingomonas sp.]MBO9713524.1 sigma-70 family RNA polymerase sigma factor [Sphingomonas sp.]